MVSKAHLVFAIMVALAVTQVIAQPDMFWISPSTPQKNAPEEFSAPRYQWASLSKGAGSRSSRPVFHVDSKGSMWIFGGYIEDQYLNAMWNYDPVQDQYRWVAGNSTVGAQYVYSGEMGVPGDDVFPGYVDYPAHAIDNNDNIWIYGAESVQENTNRMWMFNTTSLQFTWIGGDETNKNPIYGELGLEADNYWPGANEGACMVVDSKNNIWLIGGYAQSRSLNTVWHYNTTSHMWSLQHGDLTNTDQYPNFETNFWPGRWAAGCTIDEEDRVWVFGGYAATDPYANWNDMWSFDTKTVTWTAERGFEQTYHAGSVVSFDTYDVDNYPAGRDLVGMVDRRDDTIMMYGGRVRHEDASYMDIWVYNKTSQLWKLVYGPGNNYTFVDNTYGEYRGTGSTLGSRQGYSVEHGLTSRGNLIIYAGDDYFTYLNDLWIVPQDQCALGFDECDPNASCSMGWTYECTCNEGYTGDGKTCAVQVPSAAPTSSQPISSSTPSQPTSPSAGPTKATSGATNIEAVTIATAVFLSSLAL